MGHAVLVQLSKPRSTLSRTLGTDHAENSTTKNQALRGTCHGTAHRSCRGRLRYILNSTNRRCPRWCAVILLFRTQSTQYINASSFSRPPCKGASTPPQRVALDNRWSVSCPSFSCGNRPCYLSQEYVRCGASVKHTSLGAEAANFLGLFLPLD